jgi:cell division protein FtsI (penicillin-binding protein 3)
MLAAQRLDDNPCRPRHFKPPPCAPIAPDGPATELVDACRTRLAITGFLFAVVFAVVAARLVDVVLLEGGLGESHAGRFRPVVTPPSRPDIVDRNGALLATTLESRSLYADPRQIQNPTGAARVIAAVLPGLGVAQVYAKLTEAKSFVWLKRHLTPTEQYDVNRLGIPGLDFKEEERRFYPFGDLAAHVVGYCGIDNHGSAGVERAIDDKVRDKRDPVQLSLDTRVQFVVRDELKRVIADFHAKGAAGIVMDVRTGEILALVSLPDFDPNRPFSEVEFAKRADRLANADKPIFNKITVGDYELGSVFKIFNTAMALDSGVATMTKTYDAIHPIHIGRFTISDYHGKHRMLSVPEIFMYSSNIGSARMAAEAGAARQREYLGRFGLLKPAPLDLDRVSRPHYPAVWREVNVMTIAFGHGISVSPLQAITGVAAIVNGGVLHRPTLRKQSPGAGLPGVRVISPKTSEQMRKLLRLVVEHGTATKAAAPGYVVGGKTGTAEKALGGHYALKKLLSTFIGVFPMNDPKYAILAMVDEPHGNKQTYGYATAGWTVAPATGRIIERIAPILGVAPVDESSPELVQALQVRSLQGKRIEAY